MRSGGGQAGWLGGQLDTSWFRPRTHPSDNDLRPQREDALLHAHKAPQPGRGFAWSTSAPVISLVRAQFSFQRARETSGPRPFPSSRGAPSLSLCALSSSSGRGGLLCGWGPVPSVTQAQRERRAPTAHPRLSHFSSRLLGLLAESLASPSHRPRRPRRAPEARGGPRSPGKLARGSARLTAAKLPGGGGAGPGESGLRRTGGRGFGRAWAGSPWGRVSEPSTCAGRGLGMAGTVGGWPLRREAGVLPRSSSGSFPALVIVPHPDHPCPGPRPPHTAPWGTVTTSTTEGAGTSLEESAATMTVLAKEMKDVEETIGMTGKTSFS